MAEFCGRPKQVGVPHAHTHLHAEGERGAGSKRGSGRQTERDWTVRAQTRRTASQTDRQTGSMRSRLLPGVSRTVRSRLIGRQS
eukprot:3644930-Pleurochrysis_carterae.AAC.2